MVPRKLLIVLKRKIKDLTTFSLLNYYPSDEQRNVCTLIIFGVSLHSSSCPLLEDVNKSLLAVVSPTAVGILLIMR